MISKRISQDAVLQEALAIRCVEESLLEQYRLGRIRGTMHTCIGQEYLPAALGQLRIDGDMWFSNHRGHGHFLAAGLPRESLIDEILARATGISYGVGGSQHLLGQGFISNGVQGGLAPIAAGFAFAQKNRADESMSCLFIGDGTLGQGQFWEALNLSAIMGGPLLFVIEDNGISQSTLSGNTIAGDIRSRIVGFGHEYTHVDGQDIGQLCETLPHLIRDVRLKRRPQVLHVTSARLGAHSKGDDNRDPEDIESLWRRDPIRIQLHSNPSFKDTRQTLMASIQIECELSAARAESSHVPEDLARNFVDTGTTPHYVLMGEQCEPRDIDNRKQGEVLHEGLFLALEHNETAIFIGEDIENFAEGTSKPYGGAFKITRNLSDEFPGRVMNTPISEAGITGFGIGNSLAGRSAIVEIMFGDFLTQTIDQIVQQASKIPTMFGREVKLPLLVRTPMGGGLGYGATHSQNIEKLVFGLPNVLVVAVSAFPEGSDIYMGLLSLGIPSIVLEDKIAYRSSPPRVHESFGIEISSDSHLPVFMRSRAVRKEDTEPVLTIATYGGSTRACIAAQEFLYEELGLLVEIVEFTLISPLRSEEIYPSLERTRRLLVVEPGITSFGFGAELISRCVEARLEISDMQRIGCAGIIPSNRIGEVSQTPTVEDIVSKVREMVGVVRD